MVQKFAALDRALEAESWNWLEANQPELAEALQAEVGHGAQPAQVKRHVIGRTGRWELAIRCELAAAFLTANIEG